MSQSSASDRISSEARFKAFTQHAFLKLVALEVLASLYAFVFV